MNKLMPGLLLALPLMSFAQDKHVHGEAELTIALEGQSVAIEFKSPSANLLGFESAPQNAQELEAVNTVRTLLADYTNLVALNGGNCQQSSYNITGGVAAQLASHKDHDEHDHDKHEDHKDHDEHDHDKHEDHKDHDEHDHDKHDDHKDHDEHDHDKHEDHKDHDEHDHDKHDDHKDHDEHGHDKHDDHKGHDEHGHDDHADHSDEVHSDFYVSYALTCDDVSDVSEMTVTGFSAFKGLEEVDVDWVSAKQQGSSEVDANKPSVEITH